MTHFPFKKLFGLQFVIILISFVALVVWQINLATKSHIANSTSVSNQKLFGVTVAGAEFDSTAFYADKNYTGYQYFHKKGLTLIRLPFKWERVQPRANGPLSRAIDSYTSEIEAAQTAGELIIIEPHNYASYNAKPLTMNDSLRFDDLWSKIAGKYAKGYPGVWGYELMNEPHDLSGTCSTWKGLAQNAVYAIRKVDTTHYILVPGYDWQSANRWETASSCLSAIKDPSHKLIFSAHQYFDSNLSGTQYNASPCIDTNRGVALIQPFLNWLKKNNANGIFTEYGVPGNNTCWLETLDNFMKTLKNNDHIIGGTYWAAGPAWGNYALSVEPDLTNKPQMQILQKFPSN